MNDILIDKNIQDSLNKLISEEALSNETYRAAILAVKIEEVPAIAKMFASIADDELKDHHMNLVRFASMNGYQVPWNMKEFKKYASKESWKIYVNMKKDQPASYYIDLAIKSEEDAIASYEAAMKLNNVPYDLYATLQKNYYDEIEHLENLNTLKIAYEANADVSWTNMMETSDDYPDFPYCSYYW